MATNYGGVTMSNIEAIIVNGVRYDKVKTDVSPHNICDICDLHWLCEPIDSTFPVMECKVLASNKECWKINEE